MLQICWQDQLSYNNADANFWEFLRVMIIHVDDSWHSHTFVCIRGKQIKMKFVIIIIIIQGPSILKVIEFKNFSRTSFFKNIWKAEMTTKIYANIWKPRLLLDLSKLTWKTIWILKRNKANKSNKATTLTRKHWRAWKCPAETSCYQPTGWQTLLQYLGNRECASISRSR